MRVTVEMQEAELQQKAAPGTRQMESKFITEKDGAKPDAEKDGAKADAEVNLVVEPLAPTEVDKPQPKKPGRPKGRKNDSTLEKERMMAAGLSFGGSADAKVNSVKKTEPMQRWGQPVDFCTISGRWRDSRGRFCRPPSPARV